VPPVPDDQRDVAAEISAVQARLKMLEEQLAARKAVHDDEAIEQARKQADQPVPDGS
jgi:hypothetical protein